MQVLLSTATLLGTTPIYLPFNVAPLPFGDPWSDVTMSIATPSVIKVPGFDAVKASGSLVSFSVGGGAVMGTFSTGSVQSGTVYSIVASSTLNSFLVSTDSGATQMTAYTTGLQNGTASLITMHTLTGQLDGPPCPFKSGATVLAWNGGINTISGNPASITLFGAPDKSSTVTTAAYGTVLGPSTFAVIATIGWGSPRLVVLNNDWIVASGSTATLIMLQN